MANKVLLSRDVVFAEHLHQMEEASYLDKQEQNFHPTQPLPADQLPSTVIGKLDEGKHE